MPGNPYAPYTVTYQGISFRIEGKAGQRNYTIRILPEGRVRAVFRSSLGRQAREELNLILLSKLIPATPVRTGHLVRSTKVVSHRQAPAVQQGPEPWGRRTKGRSGRGRPGAGVHRYYGRFANLRSTSRKPGWIERACQQSARQMITRVKRYEKMLAELNAITPASARLNALANLR